MCADYHRYLAEIQSISIQHISINSALNSYTNATNIANQHLPTTHPIRLGLALNFSVFYYELLNNQTNAYNIATDARDSALNTINSSKDNYSNDTYAIIQLLNDNIALWI